MIGDSRVEWIEDRIKRIESLLDYKYGHENPWRLYFSPRYILLAITAINVIIFVGGTVYTGLQVSSIQQRYDEASLKILDAKQKYDEADSKLRSVQVVLNDAQQQAIKMLSDVKERVATSAGEIASIKEQSKGVLDALRKSSADTLSEMNGYRKDTEYALQQAAAQVAQKLEGEIQYNKAAIEEKQASVDDLGLKISELSAEVAAKKLQLEGVQLDLKNQLDEAGRLNADFGAAIRSIVGSGEITIPMLWKASSIWLKVLALGLLSTFFLTAVWSFLRR